MKRHTILLAILALAAFSTTNAFAKGHSGGHAHHSGSHHAAAHHSGSHAHSSHHSASNSKPHTKHATKHPTGAQAHHDSGTKKPVQGSTAETSAATPRVSHATVLSTNRRGYHRGYGQRHYHRSAHYRRGNARNGRAAFIVGPDQVVAMNSGPQVVAPWAAVVSSGTSQQGGQALHFQVTSDSNPTLFSQAPAVSPAGALSFTPASGQSGTATLTLVLRSSAGSSAPQTFHITVKRL